jgi:flavin-dependent dehydrogenase
MIYDALIVGAGPAGATAARLLAGAGWSVALIEKSPFPRRKVCGEFISATSMPLLLESEIGTAFQALAGPEVRRVGLFVGELALTSEMPEVDHPFARWGRALGREHLDLILLEAAERAGAKVFQPAKVLHMHRSDQGHLCTLSTANGAEDLQARIVIAASGSWERDPVQGQTRRAHRPSDLLAFKAHFLDSDLDPDLMPLLMFQGGYGGMVHTDSGRVSLSCCIRRDRLADCRRRHPEARAADAVLRHIKGSCSGVRDALQDARLHGEFLAAGPIQPGIRPCFAEGIFYIGNAAGEAHPVVAEGISMAMQSAKLLATTLIAAQDRIASSHGLAEAGRSYGNAWKSAFAPRIRTAGALAQMAMRPGVAGIAASTVEQFPAVLTWAARMTGKATQLVY